LIVPVPTAQVGCTTLAVGVAANGLTVTVPVPVRSPPIDAQFASLNALIAYVNTCPDALLGVTVIVSGLLLVVPDTGEPPSSVYV
jgi:hypothetical protein